MPKHEMKYAKSRFFDQKFCEFQDTRDAKDNCTRGEFQSTQGQIKHRKKLNKNLR